MAQMCSVERARKAETENSALAVEGEEEEGGLLEVADLGVLVFLLEGLEGGWEAR